MSHLGSCRPAGFVHGVCCCSVERRYFLIHLKGLSTNSCSKLKLKASPDVTRSSCDQYNIIHWEPSTETERSHQSLCLWKTAKGADPGSRRSETWILVRDDAVCGPRWSCVVWLSLYESNTWYNMKSLSRWCTKNPFAAHDHSCNFLINLVLVTAVSEPCLGVCFADICLVLYAIIFRALQLCYLFYFILLLLVFGFFFFFNCFAFK